MNIASGDGPKGDDIDSDSIRLDWQCVFWSRFEQNSTCLRFEQNLTFMPLQEQLGTATIVLWDEERKLAPIRSVKIGNVYLTSDWSGFEQNSIWLRFKQNLTSTPIQHVL